MKTYQSGSESVSSLTSIQGPCQLHLNTCLDQNPHLQIVIIVAGGVDRKVRSRGNNILRFGFSFLSRLLIVVTARRVKDVLRLCLSHADMDSPG